jgi:hypothetical protein
LSRPSTRLEPHEHRRLCLGDDDTQSQQRARNPHHRGCDDREGHNLNPEGPGPKSFRGAVHDARFPRHFRAPGNIVKYDGKINPTSGRRTTSSCVGQAGQMTIFLSSNSSQSIWQIPPEPSWTICREMAPIVGTTSGRSSPATSRGHNFQGFLKLLRGIDKILVCLGPYGFDNHRNTLR